MRMIRVVGCVLFALTIISSVYAEDEVDLDLLLEDLNLDALFDDLQDEAVAEVMEATTVEIPEDVELGESTQSFDAPMKGSEELLEDTEMVEEAVQEISADLGDLWNDDEEAEAATDEVDHSMEAVENAAESLDFLLSGSDSVDRIATPDSGKAGATLNEATDELLGAPTLIPTEIPPDEAAVSVVDSELINEANALSVAEITRLRAQELDGQKTMRKGFDALADRRYEDALLRFKSALDLIPNRPANISHLERARWGQAEAYTKIGEVQMKNTDYAGALKSSSLALGFVPNHRAAARLKRKAEGRLETAPAYVDVEKRTDVIAENESIQELLTEGRDFFQNKRYDKAENLFEQVRVIDEYNKKALQFLKRIEDQRYKLANLEREKTVSTMMQQVRDRWNPPIRKDLMKPKVGDERSTVATGDREKDQLIDKMSKLIIPSIEFRDANIIDVVEELRKQSEKADTEEGIGVNIVLKLHSGAPGPSLATPSFSSGNDFDPSDDPFSEFDNSHGGFDGQSGKIPSHRSGEDAEFSTPAYSGIRLTMILRRISLLEALKIVTEFADLKFRIDNRVVFITPKNALVDPLETRVYPVQPSLIQVIVNSSDDDQAQDRDEFIEIGTKKTFTRGDVKKFFIDAGVPFPEGTSVSYNASTSQLIVRNTLDHLDIFERILPKFNVPPPQVEIEARFVEIQQNDLQELGLEWILTDNYEIARDTRDGILGSGERVQIDADTDGITKALRFLSEGVTDTAEVAGRASSAGFVGNILSFSSVLTNPEINVVLHAIEQKGGSDLLSAPRIVTRSGVSATIEVVQEIIYPSEFTAREGADVTIAGGDATGGIEVPLVTSVVIFPETFETREVGVILNVTPTVGPDNYTIDLTLAPEVSELADWIQYGTPPFNIPQPIFASRNATTSIVIWDGQTVAMGGLINEKLVSFDDKIPILGDIPLIGRLFRSKGENSVKRNLLIFVSARIVDPSGRPVNEAQAVASTVLSSPDDLQ